MKEKDKLRELILKSHLSVNSGKLADYLLANGVIVAPMPMAEWLRQELTEHVYRRCMEEL